MKERGRGDWRWLAAWAAVAAWGLMVVISAWGAFPGKHWRGRGEYWRGRGEYWRGRGEYWRGVFPGKQRRCRTRARSRGR